MSVIKSRALLEHLFAFEDFFVNLIFTKTSSIVYGPLKKAIILSIIIPSFDL